VLPKLLEAKKRPITLAKSGETPEQTRPGSWQRTLDGLERRYGVFRVVRFAVASGTGFLVNEAVVVLGVVLLYNSFRVPSFGSSSLSILELDAVALGIGDTVAFLLNERVTVRGLGEERRKGRLHWSVRWGEYQLTSLLGNAMMVSIQLTLLATVSLSPVFGNIVGAVISYPVTYVATMRLVWRVRAFSE
jgi:putative flippase GtrA